MTTPTASARSTWQEMLGLFARPQPVTVPMVVLFAIIPLYLFIEDVVADSPVHMPAMALDHWLPVLPAWSFVYLSLFLAALLPVFVVHQQDLFRRTVLAFLTAWLVAYVCFLAYPTVVPQRAAVTGDSFAAWMLRTIHAADTDYNCLPSLHVAQCWIAALACGRVHRGVGIAAALWAFLVGLSTLFTKQHYVVDVIAGTALAFAVYLIFLHAVPRAAIPELERRLAPRLALAAVALYGVVLALMFLCYLLGVAL